VSLQRVGSISLIFAHNFVSLDKPKTSMETSSLKSIIPVFVFFLTLLLAWFIYSAIGFTKGLSTLGWPETQGKVISCEVKRVPSSKGPTKFEPVISYSYSVNSVEYTSNRYSSTMARGSRNGPRR
jgi:hypothetical protein